jgi:hypothetical protein
MNSISTTLFNHWSVKLLDSNEYEVYSYHSNESYKFKTREWAQFCADHFNKLESAAKPNLITKISSLNVSTVTRNYHPFEYSSDPSGWTCYLFGNTPNGNGLIYVPNKQNVPNAFVRWMMKICFACVWVKNKKS